MVAYKKRGSVVIARLLEEGSRKQDQPDRGVRPLFSATRFPEEPHFLLLALRMYYRLPEAHVAEAMKSLTVYRPYGSIGALRWQGGENWVGFGDESLPPSKLLTQARELKTFSEGIGQDSEHAQEIAEAVRAAKRIVFLGFAFHPQNMDVLFPPNKEPPGVGNKLIVGTTVGISDWDCELIRGDLAWRAGALIERVLPRRGLACSHLFAEHWRSLSLVRIPR